MYLILGANVGDRETSIRTAINELQKSGLDVEIVTPFVETEPEEVTEGHPLYINAGVKAKTGLNPFELLKLIETVEVKLGRKEKGMKKPRPIDIDIIFYGEKVIQTPELQIPHPRATERHFTLKILKMLCADFIHPICGRRIKEFPLPEKTGGT